MNEKKTLSCLYLLKNNVSNLIVGIIAVALGITYFIMDIYCNAQIEHRLSNLTYPIFLAGFNQPEYSSCW